MIGVGISAGLTGAKRARSIQDPLPALDLDWATDRSLPAAYGPTPSFSRASTGAFFNSSGVLATAAVNTPRFNHVYNGSSWVSKGLLVEEQRTNLILRSSDLGNSYWSKSLVSTTTNALTTPDGAVSALKIDETTSTGLHEFYSGVITVASATTYTWSVYAKAGERSWLIINASDNLARNCWFDLSTGTVGTVAATRTASITSVGNGWYRCSVTGSIASGTASYVVIMTSTGDAVASYAGTAGNGLYIFGPELEAGSFPTSYIPTTSAAVTRSADVCQITGADFSGFYNQTEGSFAVEYEQIKPLNIGMVVNFNDGGASNAMWDYASEGSSGGIDYGPSFYIRNSGTFTVQNNNSPIVSGQQKYAVAFKTNDFAMSYIGGTVQTDTTVTLPTVNQMGIGKALFYQYPFSGHIARLRYYPARLTNAKLQELST